jgi:diguanylate cyclase (GGDEF)-like protein
MIKKIFDLGKMGISLYFAKFKQAALENQFNQFNVPFLKQQVRVGVIIGVLAWLLIALMEPLNTLSSAYLSIFFTTLFATSSLALVYRATYSNLFERYHQPIILLGVLATIVSVSVKIKFYPDFEISHYMPGLMFITIWMFSISGLSLKYAVMIGLLFYAFVYVSFLMYADISRVDLITAIYYMVISYFMGAVIAVHREIQSRKIFLMHKELKQQKHHHQHKSLHDSLTQLPNRDLLEDRLEQAINTSARNKMLCAGLFIDLDKFKSINDKYGHLVGDLYLKEIAKRLQNITRDADTLARVGGDEFFLLLLDIKNEETALELSRKIQDNLNEHFILADKIKLRGLGASIGICMFPYPNCTPGAIINRADKAMYQMKRLGKKQLAT